VPSVVSMVNLAPVISVCYNRATKLARADFLLSLNFFENSAPPFPEKEVSDETPRKKVKNKY
jgi:hypothetical protein